MPVVLKDLHKVHELLSRYREVCEMIDSTDGQSCVYLLSLTREVHHDRRMLSTKINGPELSTLLTELRASYAAKLEFHGVTPEELEDTIRNCTF